MNLRWLFARLLALAVLAGALPGVAGAFDHSVLDAVLKAHVCNGQVDYAAIKTDARLEAYVTSLAEADKATTEAASRESRLAFWINAYNAITLRLVAEHYPIKSIRDIPHPGLESVWDLPVANVGGRTFTLNQIENEILRGRLKEPRIHFAVVCGARSCPPLRSEAYSEDTLDIQLDEQARDFLARKNRFDPKTRQAELSPIFDWFATDFGGDSPTVLATLGPWAPSPARAGLAGKTGEWTVVYQDYDWTLNDKR